MKSKMITTARNIGVLGVYGGFIYMEWMLHQSIPLLLQLLLCAVMILFSYFIATPVWMKSFPRKRKLVIYLLLGIVLLLSLFWDLLRTIHSGNMFSIEIFIVPVVLALLFLSMKEAIFVLSLCVVISTVNVLTHLENIVIEGVYSGLLQIGISILIIFIMNQALKVRTKLLNKQDILVENSRALVVSIDRNGKVDLCNPAMLALLGMKQNEVMGHFFWDVKVRAKGTGIEQVFQLLAQRVKVEQVELKIESRTGTATFLADTYPVNDDGLASGLIVVLNDISDRKAIEQKLYDLSATDELTQIANRRHFERRFDDEINRSNRYGRPLSFILIDLDHFKQINDTYGHLFGDKVLQTVARVLNENIRDTDLVARWGGEEFAVLMPETTREEAEEIGRRLLANVEEQSIPIQEDLSITVTFSAGIVTGVEKSSKEQMIAIADTALYDSKKNGRRCVTVGQ
ncbi:diguanylate cyclase domain-containing protein [Paenibacillus sp. sgz302251]|uniref:GGDEF domain-containing protein n=1 Tax=Paenibacillus sp. sgz302251 TaxID=3414493 RepID=UPI003C79C216